MSTNRRVNDVILQKMLRNVMVYDAGSIERAECRVNPAPFAVPPAVWESAANYALNHVIGKKRLVWQIWIGLFDLAPEGEKTFKAGTIEDVVIGKDDSLAEAVGEAIRRFMEEEESEYTVTNAWVAIPSTDVDIKANEPAFVEMFEKLGVWNIERCRAMSTARAIERKDRDSGHGTGNSGDV